MGSDQRDLRAVALGTTLGRQNTDSLGGPGQTFVSSGYVEEVLDFRSRRRRVTENAIRG